MALPVPVVPFEDAGFVGPVVCFGCFERLGVGLVEIFSGGLVWRGV